LSLKSLVDSIKKQLLPYRHPEDINRDETRWKVDDSDYLRDWLVNTLKSCSRRNKCDKKGRCVYYEYSDRAKANYRICRELILLMENGRIIVNKAEIDGEEKGQ